MEERTTVTTSKQVSEMDQNVLRAVYALNMCTVSVSQIIDYNDTYILEQEYDAILNNLNLEKMPKADALKKILVELLNTITFFRIHEIKKAEIEKKYQKKVKNAIWSAVPNLNMIIAGKPAAIAFSIASQVGIGYMNYRKEKYNALSEKEKEELELRITAIEQFHALRRELFTTAWELAEEYDFDDKLRLTEKQIKQYNQILMDRDELRKYVRLESIKDKFEAFPPFWYNFGHTASYIAGNPTLPLDENGRNYYRERAKEHFSHYEMLNKFNILREDQMTCAFALEYADLLLLEEKPENKEKIAGLISIADNMSGTALDIKQLCAISYLKIGETDKAADLLKQLVNEEYNTIVNAKILSRIYVSQFLHNSSQNARYDYKTLLMRIGEEKIEYLFPMPEIGEDDSKLQKQYLVNTKTILTTDYVTAINQLMDKYTVMFNEVFPSPYDNNCKKDYYGYDERSSNRRKEDIKKILKDKHNADAYMERLTEIGYRFRFIDLLNEALEACDELVLWKESENHDLYTTIVKSNFVANKIAMKKIQNHIDSKKFTLEDYENIQSKLNFRTFMEKMLDNLKTTIMKSIEKMTTLEEVENAEYNLVEFTQKHGLSIIDIAEYNKQSGYEQSSYLDYSLLGTDGVDENLRKESIRRKKELIKSAASELIIGNENEAAFLIQGDADFEIYFKNKNLSADSLKESTLAILDDRTKANCDLLLHEDHMIVFSRNKHKMDYDYSNIERIRTDKNVEALEIGIYEYTNKNVNIRRLEELVRALSLVDEIQQ